MITTPTDFSNWATQWVARLPQEEVDVPQEEEVEMQPVQPEPEAAAQLVPAAVVHAEAAAPHAPPAESLVGTQNDEHVVIPFKKVMQKMPLQCLSTDPLRSGKLTMSAFSVQKLFVTVADTALDFANVTSAITGVHVSDDGQFFFTAPDREPPEVAEKAEADSSAAKAEADGAAGDAAAKAEADGGAGDEPAKKKRRAVKKETEKAAKAGAKAKAKAKTKPLAQQIARTNSGAAACKLAFFRDINCSESSMCLAIGKLPVTNSPSDNADIYMHGVSSHNTLWPSVAWSMPASADCEDCTMEICVEQRIIKHTVGPTMIEVEINLPYLALKADTLDKYPAGSFVPLIRPMLRSEQIKTSSKLLKTYMKPPTMLEAMQRVCADDLKKDCAGEPVGKATPKAKTAAKADRADRFQHMSHPHLHLKEKTAKGDKMPDEKSCDGSAA